MLLKAIIAELRTIKTRSADENGVTHLGYRSPILLPQYLSELLRCFAHLPEMMTEPTLSSLSMAFRNALEGS